MFPTTRVPGLAERLHGIAYDNGFIWQVTGHQKEGTTGYEGYTPGLVKYEATRGQVDQIQIGAYQFTFHQESAVELPTTRRFDSEPATNVMFSPSLITVLVVDIRDFTGLAQRFETAMLSEVTGTLFRLGGRELQERGAWGQKYIGDAVMAVWRHKKHAPEVHELAAIF
jgi:hypothetical protein